MSPVEASLPRLDRASPLIVPLSSTLMWNDLVSGPPASTALMIEFGSLGSTWTAPELPGTPGPADFPNGDTPPGQVAELLLHAPSTTMSPVNRARALVE